MTGDAGAAGGRKIPVGWTSAHPRAIRAREVAESLRELILGGEFPVGVRLDEAELSKRFSASRNSIRDALDLLRRDGLIERRRGAGTMVTAPKYGHGLDRLEGLAESLAGHGEVHNRVLGAARVAVLPLDVACRLELDPEMGGVRLERLRFLDAEPLSLDISYLPCDIGEPLLTADLARTDVFALIEATSGVELGRAEVVVHAAPVEAEVADLLGVAVADPIFTIDRTTRLVDGRPIDSETLHVRADRLALHAVVHRDRRTST